MLQFLFGYFYRLTVAVLRLCNRATLAVLPLSSSALSANGSDSEDLIAKNDTHKFVARPCKLM